MEYRRLPRRSALDGGRVTQENKKRISAGTSEHKRDVVGLLLATDPIVHGGGQELGDTRQRQVAMIAHQLDEAGLAELPEIVFRLGDAVAVGEKDVAVVETNRALVEGHMVEKTHHHATDIESPNRAVA